MYVTYGSIAALAVESGGWRMPSTRRGRKGRYARTSRCERKRRGKQYYLPARVTTPAYLSSCVLLFGDDLGDWLYARIHYRCAGGLLIALYHIAAAPPLCGNLPATASTRTATCLTPTILTGRDDSAPSRAFAYHGLCHRHANRATLLTTREDPAARALFRSAPCRDDTSRSVR